LSRDETKLQNVKQNKTNAKSTKKTKEKETEEKETESTKFKTMSEEETDEIHGWVKLETEDGKPYFYHPNLNLTQWEEPEEGFQTVGPVESVDDLQELGIPKIPSRTRMIPSRTRMIPSRTLMNHILKLKENGSTAPPPLLRSSHNLSSGDSAEQPQKEEDHKKKYLEKVKIANLEDLMTNELKIFLTNNVFDFTAFSFSSAKRTVDEVVKDLVANKKTKKTNKKTKKTNKKTNKKTKKKTKKDSIWTYCTGSCVKKLKSLIQKEINSTAYMLRFLSNSTIDITANKDKDMPGEYPLKFSYLNRTRKNLTGKWEDDKELFDLEPLDLNGKTARFIAGLGPSAAGKTHWATNIIKLLGMTDGSFPKSFLSIDGGATREYSVVYQYIIDALGDSKIVGDSKIAGLNNLVSAGWDPYHKSLFKAGKIKKSAIKYLQEQKDKHGISMVSLYVPETLGSPMTTLLRQSYKKMSKFVDITNDSKWTGLYIWQHSTAVKCTFPDNFKCVSTTDSGERRELKEGKKYSKKAYAWSKKNGLAAIERAGGARIVIHNSGGKKNKSTVTEYPNKDGNWILNQTLLDKFNSVYEAGTFNKKSTKKKRIAGEESRREESRREEEEEDEEESSEESSEEEEESEEEEDEEEEEEEEEEEDDEEVVAKVAKVVVAAEEEAEERRREKREERREKREERREKKREERREKREEERREKREEESFKSKNFSRKRTKSKASTKERLSSSKTKKKEKRKAYEHFVESEVVNISYVGQNESDEPFSGNYSPKMKFTYDEHEGWSARMVNP
jgi:hypothetical protein